MLLKVGKSLSSWTTVSGGRTEKPCGQMPGTLASSKVMPHFCQRIEHLYYPNEKATFGISHWSERLFFSELVEMSKQWSHGHHMVFPSATWQAERGADWGIVHLIPYALLISLASWDCFLPQLKTWWLGGLSWVRPGAWKHWAIESLESVFSDLGPCDSMEVSNQGNYQGHSYIESGF